MGDLRVTKRPKDPAGAAPDALSGPAETDEAVTQAFIDHERYLKRYLAQKVANRQDAEDLSQEVYLRALSFARRENKVASWRGIFTRIAADLVVDRFRRQKARGGDLHVPLEAVQDPSDDGVTSPERILQGRQKLVNVERTLDALDPDCRRAFLLVRFHGHSYAEVAAELKIDTIAVGRLIERATLRLAKAAIETP
jgi:RNA polymerase sigma-70 factor (ECF subfamily)